MPSDMPPFGSLPRQPLSRQHLARQAAPRSHGAATSGRADNTTIHGPAYGDRPSRLWLFWRKRRARLGRGLALITLLGFAGSSGWFVMDVLPSSTRLAVLSRIIGSNPFVIRHIIIHGQQLTDRDALLDALGTGIGAPFLGFSLEEARQRINNLPFVEHSTIERTWPDTITVTIIERVPVAIWQNQGRFVLINKSGNIISAHDIESDDNTVFDKLPLVVGQGANEAATSILDLLLHYPDLQKRIIALVRIGERRWNLVLRNATVIMLPEGPLEAPLNRLSQYQADIQLLDRPLSSVDMRLPDRMVIHLDKNVVTPQETTQNSSSTPHDSGNINSKGGQNDKITESEQNGKIAPLPRPVPRKADIDPAENPAPRSILSSPESPLPPPVPPAH